jgi:adenine phosphoribosyltransferase
VDIEDLKEKIRDIPNFPKEGIVFKDITPLLADVEAFQSVIDYFAQRYADKTIDAVVAVEARGFIFGGALAYRLDSAFIPVRKAGKLPHDTHAVEYDLEYGTDKVEMHTDALKQNQRVIVVDDLIATGGTVQATCDLIEKTGAKVVECAFIIELDFLAGREKLKHWEVHSLIHY